MHGSKELVGVEDDYQELEAKCAEFLNVLLWHGLTISPRVFYDRGSP
ncbi:MAG: hypothetical protein ACTS73_02975 [Arsenophonus sp. NEOnobi-MAG3]